MIGIFDEVDEATLRGGTGLKWHQYPDDVLPLWVAEMDLPPAAAVTDAVHDAMVTGNTGYPHGDACARAMADFAHQRWDWTFPPATAVAVADVMTGIREVIELVTAPGDPVIITPPVYGPFFDVIDLAGRTRVEARLDAEGRLDPGAIEQAMQRAVEEARRAAVLLLCSPHNPTSVVHTADELATVASLARTHDVRVVVDEVHAPLVLPGVTFTPWLSLPETADDMTVLSASKGWNLAGLKAALVVGGQQGRRDLEAMPELVRHGPSHMGLIAQTAALNDATDWLDEVRAAIADNHALLAELVSRDLPGVTVTPAEATYLAWLDVRGTDLGDDPARVLREEGAVALNSGDFFGPGGAGHVRLNVATSTDRLREAVRRVAEVVTAHQSSSSRKDPA